MDIIDHNDLGQHFDKETEKRASKKQTWGIALLLIFNIVFGSLLVEANTISLNFLLTLILAVALIGASFAVALVIAAIGYRKMSFRKRFDYLVPRIYLALMSAWTVFTIVILFSSVLS
jgi:hypothetical protein